MRAFLLGMVATLVVIVAGLVAFAELGFVDFRADIQPSEAESKFAMSAVDASTDRHALETKNPLEPTEETVQAGAVLYRDNCSGCHGDPANPEATLGGRFYPPAPQFFHELHMDMMGDNQTFYIVQHGIRWTGMPGQEGVLSDTQVWQIVAFFSRMHVLPASAREVFKKSVPPAK
jgi:mono/diheme cytochrome c family protein